jgi:hypothetical protein
MVRGGEASAGDAPMSTVGTRELPRVPSKGPTLSASGTVPAPARSARVAAPPSAIAGRQRSSRAVIVRTAMVLLLLAAAIAARAPAASAAATPMVDLGSAASYAAISGASIGNTVSAVGAPHTTLRGDVGVAVATDPTGFPPGVITGATNVGNAAAVQAQADVVAAYAAILARTGGAPLDGALAGATITPGLYTIAGAASNTGTVTIDAGGNPNAVFVFQINGALAFAAASHVTLIGGAQAARVFWQVNGAGAIGAGSSFAGTMIAMDAVAIGNGSLFNGRAFARNGALTMDADEFYSAPPNVAINGGATAYTTTMNPTISGTADVVAPALVTVTINGETLTTVPSAGAWSVTPATVANGTYPVTAMVTDGAGNVGTASQSLTVDTVLPVVAIDGGAALATNDPTPTISGVSDVTVGTPVRVTVDAQSLVALVQAGGAWNVTPVALLDGTRTVAVSVRDAAGNEGVDTQELTVDTTAPAVSITGGASALTNDPTPLLAGTAALPAGMTVTVDLADETLTAIVDTGGAWSATAAHLADGPHRIVLTTSDAAGNNATATQWLTIDTIAPAMTITGGATAVTAAFTPTITGASTAAAGTTVTVTIAGQTMTTLVQGNGTWNATPTLVGLGTWPVVASAADPAGNVGTADQTLRIATNPLLPFLSIDGGATVATNDRTPTISGVTDAAAGTPVTVTVDAQTLAAVVQSGGAWSVTPAALPDGTFAVAVSVSVAGNVGAATQQLTIDTIAPTATITGGATASSSDPTPLIAGTAAVAAGTIVTVDLADQTLTALVGADGSWSTTAATLADGLHRIVITTADAAANSVGVTQWLTIATLIPALPTGSATLNVATATVGTQLRATVRWNRPATVTYRWFRNGAAIAGATTATRIVSAADLGHQVWLVASVAEAGRSVSVTTPRVTPRASSTLSLKASATRVRTGKIIVLRGVLRSAALPARQTVRLTMLQRVGSRWVTRRSVSIRTDLAGTFAMSYRVPAGRRGAWRARAAFTGGAAVRPATSPWAVFAAR